MMKSNATGRRMWMVLGLLAAMALARGATAAAQPESFPVNVNTASIEQLMEIPGIGTAKANAILEYRQQKPFDSVAELVNVKGIGDKLLAKITPYVSVSGATNPVGTGTAGN